MGFSGFRVLASFQSRDASVADGTFVRRLAGTVVTPGPAFGFTLPSADNVKDEPIGVAAKYPDGRIAATQTYTREALKEEIVLVVEAPQPIVVAADPRAEDVQPERLKGKVVDLAGKVPIAQQQVILWGKSASGALRPLVVTVTDGFWQFQRCAAEGRRRGAPGAQWRGPSNRRCRRRRRSSLWR